MIEAYAKLICLIKKIQSIICKILIENKKNYMQHKT